MVKYKFIILIFILFLNCACGVKKSDGLLVKGNYDTEFIMDKKIERIVSLAPSVSEIIYALGAGDKLVGRTIYCKYPEEIRAVESIGDILNPNIEKIISLNPDIVLASSHFKKESRDILESLNIKTLVLNGENSVEDIIDVIEKVGEITDKRQTSNKIIERIKKETENRGKKEKRKKVYYMISFGKFGDYTAGGNTYISDMIEIAGGENAVKDLNGWAYSLEALMKNQPDIIICPQGRGLKDGLLKDPLYSKLEAVKNKKVYEMNSDYIDIQGPRILKGIQELKKIIKESE